MNRRDLLKSTAAIGAAAVIGMTAKRHDVQRVTGVDDYDSVRYLRVSLQRGGQSFHTRVMVDETAWVQKSGMEREKLWQMLESIVIRSAEAA